MTTSRHILPSFGMLAFLAGSLTSCSSVHQPVPITQQRVLELTAPAHVSAPRACSIAVDGLDVPAMKRPGSSGLAINPGTLHVTLAAGAQEVVIEACRDVHFPTECEPPQQTREGSFTPTTPQAFDARKVGWTLRLKARPEGKLLAITGVAEYSDAVFLPSDFGALAGPILDNQGRIVSQNTVLRPRFQTTTTHFHLFALPGETYPVTLYRGGQPVKSTLTVKAP